MLHAKGLHKTDDGKFTLVYVSGSEIIPYQYTAEEMMIEVLREGQSSKLEDGKMYRVQYSQHAGREGQPMHYEIEIGFDDVDFNNGFLNRLANECEVKRVHRITGIPARVVKMFVNAVAHEIKPAKKNVFKMVSQFSKQLKAI